MYYTLSIISLTEKWNYYTIPSQLRASILNVSVEVFLHFYILIMIMLNVYTFLIVSLKEKWNYHTIQEPLKVSDVYHKLEECMCFVYTDITHSH